MNYRILLIFTLFICSIFAINSIENIFENSGNEKIDLKSEEVQGCEGCGEPDFTSILTISLVLIGILFLFKNKIMKRYH